MGRRSFHLPDGDVRQLPTGAMTQERVAHFLAEDWRWNLGASATRNLRVVEHLRTIAGRNRHGPAEAATAWTLNNPAVTVAMFAFVIRNRLPGSSAPALFA